MSTQLDVTPNAVLESVFEAATVAGQKLTSVRVQMNLLKLCSCESDVRDLLIYLAATKRVPLHGIIGAIKFVDRRVAIRLCRVQSDLYKQQSVVENSAFSTS